MSTLRAARVLWSAITPGVVPLYRILTTPTTGGQDLSTATSARYHVVTTRSAVSYWAATIVNPWPAIVPGPASANQVLVRHYFTTGELVTVGSPLTITPLLTVPGVGEIPFASFVLEVIA